MKKPSSMVIALVVLFVTASLVHGQPECTEYPQKIIKQKYESFTTLKITGFSLLGIAGAAAVAGVVMMSTSKWNDNSTGTSVGMSTQDPQGGAGLIMVAVAVPVGVLGTVLGFIGKSKSLQYKSCLEDFSFDYRYYRGRSSLNVSLAF